MYDSLWVYWDELLLKFGVYKINLGLLIGTYTKILPNKITYF